MSLFGDFEHHLPISINGGFLKWEGTPSHHPFKDWIFPNQNHPFLGIPVTMETPLCVSTSYAYPMGTPRTPGHLSSEKVSSWKIGQLDSCPGRLLDDFVRSLCATWTQFEGNVNVIWTQFSQKDAEKPFSYQKGRGLWILDLKTAKKGSKDNFWRVS